MVRKAVATGWGKSPKSHHNKEVRKLSHKNAVRRSKTGLKTEFKAKGGTVIGSVTGAGYKGYTNG